MSGREKGNSALSCLLDRLFERKKLSFWVPAATAALMYILFLIFGENADKAQQVLQTPVLAAVWFAGAYGVLYAQVVNPWCSSRAMDIFEVLVVAASGWSAVQAMIFFLRNMEQAFSPTIVLGTLTWSVVSLVHNQRK